MRVNFFFRFFDENITLLKFRFYIGFLRVFGFVEVFLSIAEWGSRKKFQTLCPMLIFENVDFEKIPGILQQYPLRVLNFFVIKTAIHKKKTVNFQ